MDLKTFVSMSLQQIIEGVKDAQSKEGGEHINAEQQAKQIGGNVILAGEYGLFTRVDFDVAVSAESKGRGGGSLKVLGVGVGAEGEASRGSLSRTVFSVPVRIPYGDQELAKAIREERAAKHAENMAKLRGRRTDWVL
jgi:hypothetical protein